MAFLRVEPTFDLRYEAVDHEPLIVLMPSDHRLTSREAIHPREFVGECFIGGSNKARVLRAVTEDYDGLRLFDAGNDIGRSATDASIGHPDQRVIERLQHQPYIERGASVAPDVLPVGAAFHPSTGMTFAVEDSVRHNTTRR